MGQLTRNSTVSPGALESLEGPLARDGWASSVFCSTAKSPASVPSSRLRRSARDFANASHENQGAVHTPAHGRRQRALLPSGTGDRGGADGASYRLPAVVNRLV